MRRFFFKYSISLILISVMCGSVSAQQRISRIADKVFTLAREKYVHMDSHLSSDSMPRYYLQKENRAVDSDLQWWCSGFYPGSLWYIYRYTGDETVKDLAIRNTMKLKDLPKGHTDHDIGFQIGSSFLAGYDILGDESFLPVVEEAAAKLASRFSEITGTIRSWDFLREGWQYPVIIDNLMNLELLVRASELFGCDSLRDIAVRHAETTMRNHFRDDYSSFHLVNYDPSSGDVITRETVQGYKDESCWARGEAWALYGYTMLYRLTSKEEFLHQAENIAGYVLNHLPEDGIPYWDFDAPVSAGTLKDASAAAIFASAFADLSSLSSDKTNRKNYRQISETIVRTLSLEEYLSPFGENGDFLLRHGVGNLPDRSEVDVPLSYADYYFLEALFRLSR